MSDVAQLMRAANPVPDSEAALPNDEFDALLLLTQSRRGNVDVQELTKPVEPEKRQRSGWLVAAAAFAVVIVVIGAAMLLSSPADELPPATTPPTTQAVTPTTEAVVEESVEEATATSIAPVVQVEPTVSDEQSATIAAFESAWNDGDEAAFRALFAPGATIENDLSIALGGDVDWLLEHNAGQRTMGTELSMDGCRPSGETVICTAEFDGLVPIAMNTVPWRDRYIFSFEEGQITHIKVSCIICWDGDADDRLRAWVKTVDNTAVVQLGYNNPDSEEKAAAWLEWAQKWQEAGRP